MPSIATAGGFAESGGSACSVSAENSFEPPFAHLYETGAGCGVSTCGVTRNILKRI